ncbi:hypothetical protein [Spirosoma aerolatum]|uniref:hypothetical protein n=1 Tax=Spirosoma aerolatum TaxID=1211326 RepID=UPI0012D2FBBA|nr:hypothetical protein [Spirosoma aerolatum]
MYRVLQGPLIDEQADGIMTNELPLQVNLLNRSVILWIGSGIAIRMKKRKLC